jgi:hypothetical protein
MIMIIHALGSCGLLQNEAHFEAGVGLLCFDIWLGGTLLSLGKENINREWTAQIG